MPTSTLGGGGGTKLFCSQALKATNAKMPKAIREAALIACRRFPFDPARIGECVCIIPGPRFDVCQKVGSALSPFMNSNNPLAVEPETENDAAGKNFSRPIQDFTSIEAQLKRHR